MSTRLLTRPSIELCVDREVVLVNQAFERLPACSREDVLGRPARMLCRCSDSPRTRPASRRAEQERFFARLQRGSTAILAEAPGAGLGPAFARSVVEASGGALVVVPTPPGESGARLRLTLPGLDA